MNRYAPITLATALLAVGIPAQSNVSDEPAASTTDLDPERAVVLLKRQWSDRSSWLRLRYTAIRRNLHEDKVGRWSPDETVRWWLSGSLEELQARRDSFDEDGKLRKVTIWRDGRMFVVEPGTDGWQAILKNASLRARSIDDSCPIQRYLYPTGSLLYHELGRLGLQQTKLIEPDRITGFLPVRAHLPDLAQRGSELTGMLGWHFDFQKAPDGWSLKEAWEVFTPGAIQAIDATMPYRPLRQADATVYKRTTFSQFASVAGREFPRQMYSKDPNGYLAGEIVSDVEVLDRQAMDAALQFRAPPEFGPKGKIDDRITSDVRYVGYEQGSRNKALAELLAAGEGFALAPRATASLAWTWPVSGLLLLAAWLLRERRTPGATADA